MNEYYPYLNGLHYADSDMFRQQYDKQRKKKRVAYTLWAIGGAFGFHRFYLKQYYAGTVLAAITVFTFGLFGIVGILDGFNIKSHVGHYNNDLAIKLSKNIRQKYLKGAY